MTRHNGNFVIRLIWTFLIGFKMVRIKFYCHCIIHTRKSYCAAASGYLGRFMILNYKSQTIRPETSLVCELKLESCFKAVLNILFDFKPCAAVFVALGKRQPQSVLKYGCITLKQYL